MGSVEFIMEFISAYIVPILLVIAYFLLVRYTFSLRNATQKYAKVTEQLLELNKKSLDLSREAFEESKKGFLVNFINDTVYYGTALKISGGAVDYFHGHALGVYNTVRRIDPDLAEALRAGWHSWGEGQRWKELKSMYQSLEAQLKQLREGDNQQQGVAQ